MPFEIYPVSLFLNWPMITKKTVYEIIYFFGKILGLYILLEFYFFYFSNNAMKGGGDTVFCPLIYEFSGWHVEVA